MSKPANTSGSSPPPVNAQLSVHAGSAVSLQAPLPSSRRHGMRCHSVRRYSNFEFLRSVPLKSMERASVRAGAPCRSP